MGETGRHLGVRIREYKCNLTEKHSDDSELTSHAIKLIVLMLVQGGSNVTGTNCDLFTHNQSRSYLNDLVAYYLSPTPFIGYKKKYLTPPLDSLAYKYHPLVSTHRREAK
jgi:hypothetical protein